MAKKTTVEKVMCDVCGRVEKPFFAGRLHANFSDSGGCTGTLLHTDVTKEVITGEFTFDRSYGNSVYLRHNETGRLVNIYTVDLLKVLAGRGIGTLTLTESKRGRSSCWKAEEAQE